MGCTESRGNQQGTVVEERRSSIKQEDLQVREATDQRQPSPAAASGQDGFSSTDMEPGIGRNMNGKDSRNQSASIEMMVVAEQQSAAPMPTLLHSDTGSTGINSRSRSPKSLQSEQSAGGIGPSLMNVLNPLQSGAGASPRGEGIPNVGLSSSISGVLKQIDPQMMESTSSFKSAGSKRVTFEVPEGRGERKDRAVEALQWTSHDDASGSPSRRKSPSSSGDRLSAGSSSPGPLSSMFPIFGQGASGSLPPLAPSAAVTAQGASGSGQGTAARFIAQNQGGLGSVVPLQHGSGGQQGRTNGGDGRPGATVTASTAKTRKRKFDFKGARSRASLANSVQHHREEKEHHLLHSSTSSGKTKSGSDMPWSNLSSTDTNLTENYYGQCFTASGVPMGNVGMPSAPIAPEQQSRCGSAVSSSGTTDPFGNSESMQLGLVAEQVLMEHPASGKPPVVPGVLVLTGEAVEQKPQNRVQEWLKASKQRSPPTSRAGSDAFDQTPDRNPLPAMMTSLSSRYMGTDTADSGTSRSVSMSEFPQVVQRTQSFTNSTPGTTGVQPSHAGSSYNVHPGQSVMSTGSQSILDHSRGSRQETVEEPSSGDHSPRDCAPHPETGNSPKASLLSFPMGNLHSGGAPNPQLANGTMHASVANSSVSVYGPGRQGASTTTTLAFQSTTTRAESSVADPLHLHGGLTSMSTAVTRGSPSRSESPLNSASRSPIRSPPPAGRAMGSPPPAIHQTPGTQSGDHHSHDLATKAEAAGKREEALQSGDAGTVDPDLLE